MRNILFYIWTFIILFFSIPLLIVAKITKNPKITIKYIYFFASTTNFVMGNKVKVINIEKYNNINGPFLMVANHESFFDLYSIYVTLRGIPFTVVAKKELSKVPILSSWMKTSHVVFLDRKNSRQSIKDMQKAVGFLKSGLSMGILPEGTRSTEDMEFKPGSLKIAYKSQVTILPVTFRNTASIFEERKTSKNQETLVYIHEPINYEDYKDIDIIELSNEIQNKIQSIKKEDYLK